MSDKNNSKINDQDQAAGVSAKEAGESKVMCVLAYIGILWLIPLLSSKSQYVRFHTNQGLVLFIVEAIYLILRQVIYWILFGISWSAAAIVSTVFWVGSTVFLILAIIGIKNALQCKAKQLPVIGKVKILK